MHKTTAVLLLGTLLLAGCSSASDPPADPVASVPLVEDVQGLVNHTIAYGVPMVFEASVVDAAVSLASDLYEPTMEVSRDGTIFITGHTAVVDTTGAPVYGSWDDGASWSQLPFTRDLMMPAGLPGATPPVTDEIFLVAGDDGWLYGVDITLATFPVNAWSEDGRVHAYFNPNAYDEHQAALQADQCLAAPAKDRPWAAYANGALLMVSNPASGPAQIGVLEVPVGNGLLGVDAPYGVGATTSGGRWNMCAGLGTAPADSSIPGIPDMRPDGLFVVPQRSAGILDSSGQATNHLFLIIGNKENIYQLRVEALFEHSTFGEITSVYGQAAFDADGALFVGITQNEQDGQNITGQLRIASSTDGAKTFAERTFVTGNSPVRHMYMDGNRFGPGSLIVWAVDGNTTDGEGNVLAYDWYAAHVQLDAGTPVLENASLIIDEGAQPSAHVTGAALGPDGRGYTAMYESAGQGGTPLSVFIQRSGPTMPVTVEA